MGIGMRNFLNQYAKFFKSWKHPEIKNCDLLLEAKTQTSWFSSSRVQSYCPDLTSICEITAAYTNRYAKLRKSVCEIKKVSIHNDANQYARCWKSGCEMIGLGARDENNRDWANQIRCPNWDEFSARISCWRANKILSIAVWTPWLRQGSSVSYCNSSLNFEVDLDRHNYWNIGSDSRFVIPWFALGVPSFRTSNTIVSKHFQYHCFQTKFRYSHFESHRFELRNSAFRTSNTIVSKRFFFFFYW